MIRITIVPDVTPYKISLEFPEDYLGQEIEIVALKKHSDFPKNTSSSKKFASFDAIKIDTTEYKFNRDEANER